MQGLPGLEPGLLDSESKVITNYTIGPDDLLSAAAAFKILVTTKIQMSELFL